MFFGFPQSEDRIPLLGGISRTTVATSLGALWVRDAGKDTPYIVTKI